MHCCHALQAVCSEWPRSAGVGGGAGGVRCMGYIRVIIKGKALGGGRDAIRKTVDTPKKLLSDEGLSIQFSL